MSIWSFFFATLNSIYTFRWFDNQSQEDFYQSLPVITASPFAASQPHFIDS